MEKTGFISNSLRPKSRQNGQDFNAAAAEVTVRPTNSGTFLVVAADGISGLGGTGDYRISLARTGSPLIDANAAAN